MPDKDVIQGELKQAEGKVQSTAGHVVNSKEDEAAGAVKQVEGKIQEGIGHIKEAIHDATK